MRKCLHLLMVVSRILALCLKITTINPYINLNVYVGNIYITLCFIILLLPSMQRDIVIRTVIVLFSKMTSV